MSILLVDIGNTRVKWGLLRGSTLGRAHALAHGRRAAAFDELLRRLPRPERIVAVCVGGEKLERALDRAARREWGIRPQFVRSARKTAGVTNGYREAWRLGADRWVATLGAHALARGRDALIVSVGTALTVDLVTDAGRHLGGAIIPSPTHMVESLLSGTHGIRRRAAGNHGSPRKLFAADTASALAAGARFAAAAFVDRAVREAALLLGRRPLVLLTGGGARELKDSLRTPVRPVPDLVLRGLAACAAAR
jgi:type III pantothenate kinase